MVNPCFLLVHLSSERSPLFPLIEKIEQQKSGKYNGNPTAVNTTRMAKIIIELLVIYGIIFHRVVECAIRLS